jgi:hypothetical protein
MLASPALAETNPPSATVRTAYRGLTLAAALERLQVEGLAVVFSSALVEPQMRVDREPTATDLRTKLAELLAPHGLMAVSAPRGRVVVIRSPVRLPEAPIGLTTAAEEVDVTTAAPTSLHGEPIDATPLVLLQAERDVPHLGGDVFRAAGLVAGARTSEASSRVAIRGGRADDLLVLLDGVELVAPYHLPEFDQALGIVSREVLEYAEIITDPLPAEYGDRLGGVLDMRTRAPRGTLGLTVTLSSLFAELSATSTFADERGHLLATARAGNYRLALEAAGQPVDPRFSDFFGRVGYSLSNSQELQVRVLQADDEVALAGTDTREGGSYGGRWSNAYVWASHQASWRGQSVLDSTVWTARLERNRSATALVVGNTTIDVADAREFDLTGIKSVLRVAANNTAWSLDTGFDIREFHAEIDYLGVSTDLLGGGPGASSLAQTRFENTYDFDQLGTFASLRWAPTPALTVEAGLRYDRLGLTDEAHLSPRGHAALAVAGGTLRAGWGWHYQGQRPYELQVEDGETALQGAERSAQSLLSFEHPRPSGATLRVALFERVQADPRARWESVFDTGSLYPEFEAQRVRIDPSRGRARGIELGWLAAAHPRLQWSAHYTLSRVEDRLAGRWVPSATDETHALVAQTRLELGRSWHLGVVWRFNSGWPTTAILAQTVLVDGTVVARPVAGPLRAERLPNYHRLDLRVGRSWKVRRGRLSASLDLQNLYGRANVRGYTDIEVNFDQAGQLVVEREQVTWGTFVPSFSVRWQL